jgi:pyruvate dehydrogenase E2 component (dihydrolipoamide acetyltransferase)
MMADIVMPRLSDTMEEGTILRWLKRDGERVARGEELVEIETDKASMTYESDQEGVLAIVAAEGDTLAIGQVIARVGVAAEPQGAPAAAPVSPEPVSPEPASPEPASPAPASPAPASPAPVRPAPVSPAPAPPVVARAVAADGHAGGAPASSERIKASPLAKRIAREAGVALETLTGSGPGGRIVRADVEAARGAEALPSATAAPAAAPSVAAPAPADVMTAKGQTTSHELSRTQQLIARRMAESKATIPHFTLQAEIDMEQCVALREALAKATAAGAPTPTYNDMIVKACALALREFRRVNGSYRDGQVQLHSRVNVGVAVAVEPDDPLQGALVVPTVFDADTKSLGEIARETRALAERVRAGTITPPELSGGTFTVSNLGMYGIRSFAAIINPPQVAILAVGALAPRAIVRGQEIVARNTMATTLACDHRVLYGADAARFHARIRALLEEPAALAL